jgi:hypothetical protein
MRSVCLLTFLLAATGCSYTPPLELTPVTGRITVAGKPLPAGRVVFVPVSGVGREGRGVVDTTGRYSVTLDGAPPDKTGMPPGKYNVLVFAIKPSQEMKPPEWLASPKYADAKTSQLSVEVQKAAEKEPAGKPFDLTLEP